MAKSIIVLLGLFFLCSCQEKQNPNALNFQNDVLIVKDIDNIELKLSEAAKDSLIKLLKKRNIFSSESLWCIIEINQKAKYLPMPFGIDDDTTAYEIDWGKHYVVWFNSSIEDKAIFNELREKESNKAQPFLELKWDLVARINFKKNELLQTF